MTFAPKTLDAGCKINLYLEITGLRDDGYHELNTLFHPLPEPFDTLSARPGETGTGLTLICDNPELEGEANIVAKAYGLVCQASGQRPDVRLELAKRIPMGAGLGGGSSDAAAALRLYNHALDGGLDEATLHGLATRLGADVPFFLLNEPAWATGIGEKLVRAEDFISGGGLSAMTLVLVCPRVHVSTARAYGDWDRHHLGSEKSESTFLTSPSKTAKDTVLQRSWKLFNSFETVVFSQHPVLRSIKERLLALGAAAALMSGSGSSLFGLFRDHGQAGEAMATLAGELEAEVHAIEL